MKSGLVSITISMPSRRSRSSTGRQKVPTPGPYSTNSRHSSHFTGASILAIVKRDEGMIEPTITGCSRNPSKKTPHGPRKPHDPAPELVWQAPRGASSVLVMRQATLLVARGRRPAFAGFAPALQASRTGYRISWTLSCGRHSRTPLSVSTSGRSISRGSAAIAASTVASSAAGRPRSSASVPRRRRPCCGRDPGVVVELGELRRARRVRQIFDHGHVDPGRILKDRQGLARGAAGRVVPDRRFHGVASCRSGRSRVKPSAAPGCDRPWSAAALAHRRRRARRSAPGSTDRDRTVPRARPRRGPAIRST